MSSACEDEVYDWGRLLSSIHNCNASASKAQEHNAAGIQLRAYAIQVHDPADVVQLWHQGALRLFPNPVDSTGNRYDDHEGPAACLLIPAHSNKGV